MSESRPALSGSVLPSTAEIIPGQFTFSITRTHSPGFAFTIEGNRTFAYQPFFSDFGPLSLHQVHRFVSLALSHLHEHGAPVEFYCTSNPQQIANAALLAACFRVVHLQLPPDAALAPLAPLLARARPYRDACSLPSTYDLTVAACVHGLARAMRLGWYSFAAFDPARWAELEQIDRGDMNWLVPGKLLAFASPYHTRVVQGFRVCTPADLVPVFRALGITAVVRLNEKTYNEGVFRDAGFDFAEMAFPDGSCPPEPVLERFLALIEGRAVVALHCKAGLGRTGTLAGCFLIKQFEFSAAEAIGWIRICRPGSVIGPQQQFLVRYGQRLRQAFAPERPTRPNLALAVEKDAARAGKRADAAPEEVRTPPAVRSRDGGGMRMQALSLTPPVPQPRKLQRAQDRARTTPRKLS
jgi:cell division cycle 14